MGGEHVVESEKKEGPNVVAAPGVASPFQGAAADPWLPLDVSIGSHRLSIASSKPSGDDLLDGVRKTLGSLGEPTASAHVSVLATGTQNESGAPGSSRQIKGEATSMFIVPQGAERQEHVHVLQSPQRSEHVAQEDAAGASTANQPPSYRGRSKLKDDGDHYATSKVHVATPISEEDLLQGGLGEGSPSTELLQEGGHGEISPEMLIEDEPEMPLEDEPEMAVETNLEELAAILCEDDAIPHGDRNTPPSPDVASPGFGLASEYGAGPASVPKPPTAAPEVMPEDVILVQRPTLPLTDNDDDLEVPPLLGPPARSQRDQAAQFEAVPLVKQQPSAFEVLTAFPDDGDAVASPPPEAKRVTWDARDVPGPPVGAPIVGRSSAGSPVGSPRDLDSARALSRGPRGYDVPSANGTLGTLEAVLEAAAQDDAANGITGYAPRDARPSGGTLGTPGAILEATALADAAGGPGADTPRTILAALDPLATTAPADAATCVPLVGSLGATGVAAAPAGAGVAVQALGAGARGAAPVGTPLVVVDDPRELLYDRTLALAMAGATFLLAACGRSGPEFAQRVGRWALRHPFHVGAAACFGLAVAPWVAAAMLMCWHVLRRLANLDLRAEAGKPTVGGLLSMPDLMACMINRHAVMIREAREQLNNQRAMRRRTDWIPGKDQVVGRAASPRAAKRAIFRGILHAVLRRKRLLVVGAAAGVVVLSQALQGAFGSQVADGRAGSPTGPDRYPGGVLGPSRGQGGGATAVEGAPLYVERVYPEGSQEISRAGEI